MKIITEFKKVPNNTRFYVRRFENGIDADSVGFFKLCSNVCEDINGEWSPVTMEDSQRCWYFED